VRYLAASLRGFGYCFCHPASFELAGIVINRFDCFSRRRPEEIRNILANASIGRINGRDTMMGGKMHIPGGFSVSID